MSNQLASRQSDNACQFDQLRINAANACIQRQIDRKGGCDGDKCDLWNFADSKPDDEQRHQRDDGQGPEHLNGRINDVLTDLRQAGYQGETSAEQYREREALGGTAQGDEQVMLQLAGREQRAEARENLTRGRQSATGYDAGRGSHLPQGEQQQRTDHAKPTKGGSAGRSRDRRYGSDGLE